MRADEIVSSLVESLNKAANADPRLLAAFDRAQCTEALEQGMAIEGHVDFAALKSALVEKGAPEDVIRRIMLQLDAEATNKGLTVIEGLFQDPAAETVIAADGFLPAAELKKEKEIVDNALVAVVVRNADLHVDMDEFRGKMLAALDAALQTGDVDLEPLAQFLSGTETEETARHETLLTLIQLSKQGKTRYKLALPASMSTLTEAEQTAVLDAFNKRCPPPKDATPSLQAKPKPKPDERKDKKAQPAYVPPKAEKGKAKKKGKGWLIFAGIMLLAGGGVGVWRVQPPTKFTTASVVLPAGAMPCSQLLTKGKTLFCGLKLSGWSELSKRTPKEVDAMKAKTKEVATAAGFTTVNYGLDASK